MADNTPEKLIANASKAQKDYLAAKDSFLHTKKEAEDVIQEASQALTSSLLDAAKAKTQLEEIHKREQAKLKTFIEKKTAEQAARQEFLAFSFIALTKLNTKANRTTGQAKMKADDWPGLKELIDARSKAAADTGTTDLLSVKWSEIAKEKKIGEGGFGAVFKGTCKGLDVAVKILKDLSDIQKGRFKAEAKLLSALKHDSIISFMGICENAEYEGQVALALITEFAPNKSLAEYVGPKAEKRFSQIESLQILREVVGGMNYLHAQTAGAGAILHLDIKPANILLDDCMRARIADFGMSKVLTTEPSKSFSVAGGGAAGGTPLYMAPEIILGKTAVTASDVFSFGIMACEVLENLDSPYSEAIRKDYATLKDYVVDKNGRPLGLPDKVNTNNPIHKFYDSCWKKEPADRTTFAKLATDLSEEPWTGIISTFMANDKKTITCWKQCLQEANKDGSVNWDIFISKFEQAFSMSSISSDKKYAMSLSAILGVNLADTSSEANRKVTADNWERFTRCFCPIHNIQETMDTIHAMITSDWFFGNIDQYEANNRLMFEPRGTFLVRFSQFKESKRGQFTLSYVGRDKLDASVVLHTRLGEVDPSRIVPHIKHLMKQHKKKVGKPCPENRPAIFTSVPKKS